MTALAKVSNGSVLPTLSNWMEGWYNGNLLNGFSNLDSSFNMPAVNIRERADSFMIELAAPGKKKSDFEIHLENKVLSIGSNAQQEHEENSDGYMRREFAYSSFKRTFRIPDTVDGEKISAEYRDGILFLHLPKLEEAKEKPPRAIKIK